MRDYRKLFSRIGTPCGDVRIKEIEETLGRTLPQHYRELIKDSGGGILKSKNCFIPEDHTPDSNPDGIIVDRIYGNGSDNNGSSTDLATHGKFLSEEWGIPDEVLLFAESESGMHECFAINYDLAEFPPHSILYIDTDPDGQLTQVAGSFNEFLNLLSSDPEEDDEESESGSTHLEGARSGALSPSLLKVLESAPRRDAEEILRKVIEPLAESSSFRIESDEKGRTLLDVFFWLLSHYRPVYNLDDFSGLGDESNEPNFRVMSLGSFLREERGHSLGYSEGVLKRWWKDRSGRGLLKETGYGYELDEGHMEEIFRKAENQP